MLKIIAALAFFIVLMLCLLVLARIGWVLVDILDELQCIADRVCKDKHTH